MWSLVSLLKSKPTSSEQYYISLRKNKKQKPRALLMISEGYNEPLLLLVRFTAVLRLHLSCWLSGHGLNHSYYTCLNANVINMKVCIQ